MSKLQQAPGELELVRAFVNTVDIEQGTEELEDPGSLTRWLERRGMLSAGSRASASDLARAIELREALRAILLSHNGGPENTAGAARTLNAIATRAKVRLRFDEQGIGILEPGAGGVDGALGRLLAIVHAAIGDRSWERLKACREHTCEWAFYDHTKNRSGTWCNMAICGNRAKARTYRERRIA